MRADRLLNILLTVQSLKKTTVKHLARRLEVSERTVYRDLVALSDAGVPVVASSGPGGGVWLLGDYKTDLTGLNSSEAAALLLAGAPISDLGFEPPTEQAMLKLFSAMPKTNNGTLQNLRERLLVDADKWTPAREPTPVLGQLQKAVETQQRLQIHHQKQVGVVSRRTLNPLGLVVKASVWYLVAQTEQGIRTFRASRITKVKILEQGFLYPKDFHLKTFWKSWSESFEKKAKVPELKMKLRLKSGLQKKFILRLKERTHAETQFGKTKNGWCDINANLVAPEFAIIVLTEFNENIEVVAPAAWRNKLKSLAASWQRLYA